MIQPYASRAVTNLKKTRGQIDRIFLMIEEKKDCVDILQQVNAALGLLKKTNKYILESHLLACGTKKFAGDDQKSKEAFVKTIVQVCDMVGR